MFSNITSRERWAICLWQQALNIESGIGILLESNLPGAALALTRPLFECYVRGVWLSDAATEDEIKKFISGNGKYHSKFSLSNLVKSIGNDTETEGAWIDEMSVHIEVLHDLTHGGTSHISARCFPDIIEPRYPEYNLISLAYIGIEIKIRINKAILARMKKEEALSLLENKAEKIRNLFQFIRPDVSN